MDKNDPPIIKSGSHHSVAVPQGSKNAKTAKNYVKVQEQDEPDSFAAEGPASERKQAVLQQGEAEPIVAHAPRVSAADEPLAARADNVQQIDDPEAASAQRILIEEDAPKASGSGPVIEQIVGADQDAQASKAPHAADRWVNASEGVTADQDAHGSKAPHEADRFVNVSEGVAADQDAQASKAPLEADRFVNVAEEASAPSGEVAFEEEKTITNRQKLQQLQQAANRINIDAMALAKGQGDHAQAGERELAELDISPEASPSRPDEEAPVEEAVAPVAPAVEVDLPPEVAANLPHTKSASAARDSEFLARVRALKSNMSVTDTRLSELLNKPSVPNA